MNAAIINSITRLHLVGYFYWVILRCTDPWISRDYRHMDKKTSDFLRHMFFLIFTDHEIKSPVVLLRNFLQSIFNGKLNYVFRQELNRSSFSFFVLEKRAKYGMMLISFEDLLPYQLPFPKSKPKKICVKMVKQICNCPHHMGICGL